MHTLNTVQRERSQYLTQILTILLVALHDNQAKFIQNEINKIAIENQQLLQCNTPTFQYRGKWYSEAKNYAYHKGYNTILLPQFHATLERLLYPNQFELEQAKIKIRSYFTELFLFCATVDELEYCTPPSIHGLIQPIIDPLAFNTLPEHTLEELSFFKEKLNSQNSALQEHLVAELLLQA